MAGLKAGAGQADISPRDSQFLFGYPHVARFSAGIHDPLLSTALYLSDGPTELMFVANDIIFVSKASVARARRLIAERTGIPAANIMITATHTHSGPKTVDHASNDDDPAVPPADPAYLAWLEVGMAAAAVEACETARPAELGLAVADGRGVGTNRRDPAHGPSDPQVPVLAVRSGGAFVAGMLVYGMHPTVLHEDSLLVSADFPGMARRYLQEHVFGGACPILYHTGPAGNQSVRYVTRENTFAEAERLGAMLGRAVEAVVPDIVYHASLPLAAARTLIDLPRRPLPGVEEAAHELAQAAGRLAHLNATGAARTQVRRAEVDWFGAEETLALARAAAAGRLGPYYQSCLPAEVQAFRIGPWSFVGWPGEIFVEYGLAVKQAVPDSFVISLANGELQGYIATTRDAQVGGYETANALFAPETGTALVETTLELLQKHLRPT